MARKEKMKVYHGIPKSVTDEHTVFYASFDGILTPETGNTYECNYQSPKFVDSVIGYGLQNVVYTSDTKYSSPLQFENYDEVTIEFFYDATKVTTFTGGNEQYGLYLQNKGIGIIRVLSFLNNNKTLSLRFYNSSGGTLDTITIKTEGLLNHIRLTYNRGIVNVYINGVKKLQYTKLVIDKIDNIFMYQLQAIVSDLHISNIDRGDYFPNLPQDFIDGKATIKPRMGQQQIKGDPMYSQVTDVCVPHYDDDTQHLYYTSGIEGYLINNPEVFGVRGAVDWSRGSAFKIKGLNGEVISGVIDTDTALAKVTKVISPSKYVLNTIQGLSAEDTIRFYISTSSSPECTIKEVDVTTNTITLNTALSGWEVVSNYYVIETTASSSSPIVKTQDGTTVVGTWSGLGTNEATFTLGENADISGKDLYVTYALTMPLGNSDFPELPHTIERAWGENGVEMKPVNHIVITDDFKGKISGSLKECPHIVKAVAFTTLITPNESRWAEWTNYSKFNQLDNDSQSASTTLNAHIPMQLFSFNLIEMIERKLGCEIPIRDKISWINLNVSVSVNVYAKGSCPQGFYVQLNIYKEGVGWVDPVYNSTDTYAQMSWANIIYDGRVDSNGFIHFLLSTKPSDGATNSTIYTDYVEIQISLKTDSTFTTLYCENTRAREDKCNPVLIQKETKTVKRYLPSKECFATECTYAPIPSANKLRPEGAFNKLCKGRYYLSSRGTGAKNTKFFESEYLGQLLYKNELYNFTGDSFIEIPVDTFITKSSNNDYYNYFTMLELSPDKNIVKDLLNAKSDVGYTSAQGVHRFLESTENLIDENESIYDYYCIGLNLFENGGELYLLVMNCPGNLIYTSSKKAYTDLYILPNRPLIK